MNSPSAVIRKETIIDENGIEDLLGYIYEDVDSHGTDKLPIPSICVDIYIPNDIIPKVSMYNGTSLELTLDEIKENNLFFGNEVDENYVSESSVLPGSTYVTVSYVNSRGEILKENKISNLFPGTTFVPEFLPIISDIQGKEWKSELDRINPITVMANPEQNVIKLKYIERYTRVTFSFINREGKKISEDKQELIQVGEVYDFNSKETIIDKENNEWNLKFARPSKFTARDDEEKNKVILVYDVDRADVLIKYISKSSLREISESIKITTSANKKYAVDVPRYLVDSDGLGWNYVEGTETNIYVEKDILNEVTLYYTEAKVPVTMRFKNENNISLTDDKVELVQIGKKYTYDFDNELTDFSCREWKLKDRPKEIVVSKDKEKNIIDGVYEPILASVIVRFLNTNNRPIKSDKIEQAQIGEIFNSENLDEIIDNFGKVWKCASEGEKIVVKGQEIKNEITLRYEPLMSRITIKYLGIDMNELMEAKYVELQVGSEYKDKPIEKFTSKDGKKWKIDSKKVDSVIVKKHEEENVYEVYYDKELTKIKLSFCDAYGNTLKDNTEIEAQIGAELDLKLYSKITDKDGGRWGLETTEPSNLIVKDKNNFVKIIYDEIKANVLIKHINVRTQKIIIENQLVKVKLGGIYMPSIQSKIIDKNKYRWKYIGDENVSIVVKENEQENIIMLNYDEDRSKIILRYINEKNEKIREDVEKEIQIGKEIKLEPIQKFRDNEGLAWRYRDLKMQSSVVEEKDNIVYMTYEPLMSEIKIKYVNSNNENLIDEKIVKRQVGKEFLPEIIDRIKSKDNKAWIYSRVSEERIIVDEKINEITMIFEEIMRDITVQLVNEEGTLIADPIIYSKQVGEEFEIPYEKGYVDKDGKAWIVTKLDKNILITSEDIANNVVKVWYQKELVDVKLVYYSDVKQIIKAATTEKVQIGSIYTPIPVKEIIDEKTTLGWKLPDNFKLEYKVKRNPDENILEIPYEKLIVNVLVKYKDTNGVKIIEDSVYTGQVGTNFTPKVEMVMLDLENREWLYGAQEETKLFGGAKNKIPTIKILRDEKENVADLIYRPSLIKVTIRYQEALGNLIRQDKIVDAQIGSIYEAEIIEVITDNKKVKWVYNPNSKPIIKVGHEEKENIIFLAYEEEKALVTYKYQDEYGNRLRSPKRKLVQIGSMHTPEIENIIEDYQGKVWEYKAKSIDKLEIKDDESTNVIEIIYKPLNVEVVLKFVNVHGKQLSNEKIVKAQLGSEFLPEIQEKITDEESKLYKFIKCEPQTIKIREVPIGAIESPNTFELTYEPVFSEVTVMYKTVDGEKIKDDLTTQMQVGLVYKPVMAQYVNDENGLQWELISKDIDSIRVKEDSRENIISMIYEVAKTEVTIRYKDVLGNTILNSTIIPIEIGKEFIPEIKDEIVDGNGKKWVFAVVEPVKLTVGSINNIVTITYQEKKTEVIVKYITKDGKKLKEDFKTKVQIGTKYEPQNTTKVIYDESEIWRFSYNEPSRIVVSENISENVITQIYTKEEKNIEEKNKNGTYYNPEIEKFLDKNLMEETNVDVEDEEKSKSNNDTPSSGNKIKQEKHEENTEITFEDENLKILEKNISLTDKEKIAISKLNKINNDIIQYLNLAISQNDEVDYIALENQINERMIEEKQIIQQELNSFIETDKTGRKLLKIFEAIVASEALDKNFYGLQQRKAISVADYFINTIITDMEQAAYICDKGIVEKAIECADKKIAASLDNAEEYKKIKVVLLYEKILLNNYNKARSQVKDDYFKNYESKNLISSEVVILVVNNMPKQAYKLLTKLPNLSLIKENELEAIMKLLTEQQLGTLITMVGSISDSKLRKIIMKKIKEITS